MANTDEPGEPGVSPAKKTLSRLAVAGFALASIAFMTLIVGFVAEVRSSRWDSCFDWKTVSSASLAITFVAFPVSAILSLVALVFLVVRRARLRGKRFVALAALTLAISMVWPNFFAHPNRTKHSEAKAGLRAVFSALKAKGSVEMKYAGSLSETAFAVDTGRRYALFYRDDVIQPDRPGHGPYSKRDFPPALVKYLDECKEREFVAVAIGNIDADPNLDVWAIDNRNYLVNVFDDRCDEAWSGDNPCEKDPGK